MWNIAIYVMVLVCQPVMSFLLCEVFSPVRTCSYMHPYILLFTYFNLVHNIMTQGLLCLGGWSPGSIQYSSCFFCVCVIYCSTLFSETATMKVAMQLQLNIVTQLNWLDFRFEALLSSYSMMCSPWRLSSVIQSLVKSKLLTTNYLSPWKLHLYNEIDGDLSEILRTQTSKSKLYNIGLACCYEILMTC